MACSTKPTSSEAAPKRCSLSGLAVGDSCRVNRPGNNQDLSYRSQPRSKRFVAPNAIQGKARHSSTHNFRTHPLNAGSVNRNRKVQLGISPQRFDRSATTRTDQPTNRLPYLSTERVYFWENDLMKRTSRRLGFTLVELLVVIAIIGILVAITIPAVQMVRARANQAACNNNLRQLGMAVVEYETNKGKYPASINNANANTVFPWVVGLLNSIDQNVLYDELQQAVSTGNDAMLLMDPTVNNSYFDEAYIKILNCPSDPNKLFYGPQISYVANMGTRDGTISPPQLDFKEIGIFHNRTAAVNAANLDVTLDRDALRDGESYTMLLAENGNAFAWGPMPDSGDTAENERFFYRQYPEISHGMVYFPVVQPPTVSVNFGACPSIYGNNFSPWLEKPTDLDCWIGATIDDKYYFARPSSFHSQGFNVVFAGGRTQYISESIDYTVYAKMMTPDGQELPQGTVGRGIIGDNEIE